MWPDVPLCVVRDVSSVWIFWRDGELSSYSRSPGSLQPNAVVHAVRWVEYLSEREGGNDEIVCVLSSLLRARHDGSG